MPVICAAVGCANKFIKGSEIRFYRFPLSKPQLADQWVHSLGMKDFIPTGNTCLCSDHFMPDCFWVYNGKQVLKGDAVPTILSPDSTIQLGRRAVVPTEPNLANPMGMQPDRDRAREAAGLQAREAAGLQAREAAGLQAREAAGLQAREVAGLLASKAAGLQARVAAGLQAREAAGLQAREAAGLQAREAARLQAGEAAGLQAGEAAGLQAWKAAGLQAREAAGLQAREAAGLRREKRGGNRGRGRGRGGRKMSGDRQNMAARGKVYDSKGRLLSNGVDMCDCLEVECFGCFSPCPGCGSRKCGVECRCDRKWLYEQVEEEGGEITRNMFAV